MNLQKEMVKFALSCEQELFRKKALVDLIFMSWYEFLFLPLFLEGKKTPNQFIIENARGLD